MHVERMEEPFYSNDVKITFNRSTTFTGVSIGARMMLMHAWGWIGHLG